MVHASQSDIRKAKNLSAVFLMLSTFDANEPGQYDWLLSGWLKVLCSTTRIYFDISYAGKANGFMKAVFIRNSSLSCTFDS